MERWGCGAQPMPGGVATRCPIDGRWPAGWPAAPSMGGGRAAASAAPRPGWRAPRRAAAPGRRSRRRMCVGGRHGGYDCRAAVLPPPGAPRVPVLAARVAAGSRRGRAATAWVHRHGRRRARWWGAATAAGRPRRWRCVAAGCGHRSPRGGWRRLRWVGRRRGLPAHGVGGAVGVAVLVPAPPPRHLPLGGGEWRSGCVGKRERLSALFFFSAGAAGGMYGWLY